MGRILAVLAAALLVGIVGASAQSERQSVAGHFNLPPAFVRPSVAASPGANAVSNPGFESGQIDGGWRQCGDVDAYVTTQHPYAGAYDEYSGTRSGVGEPRGNSGVCQRVTIPHRAVLRARLYQLSNEPGVAFAYQEADLLDDRGNVVVNLFKSVNDRPAWVLGRWNLGAYAGRTFWLYFGVHGDGDPKLATQQYVDEVVLTDSGSAGPK